MRLKKSTDVLFRIGIILKGVDAVFEVIGGILLTMPTKIARYLSVLSQHEIYRHHQVLSGRIDHLADALTGRPHLGAALYLIVHGGAKVILIVGIFRARKWGYLGLIGVLGFFTLVELTRFVAAHEWVTGVLGVFDLAVVVLIWKEYRARFIDKA